MDIILIFPSFISLLITDILLSLIEKVFKMIMQALFNDNFSVMDFLYLNGKFPKVHPCQDNHMLV